MTNDTMRIAAIAYCSVWGVLFLLGILFGVVLKKDILGNGVKCGIMNSFILSTFWPVTLFVLAVGWAISVWKGWKRL